MTLPSRADVVIAGGGPAGLAAAIAITRSGFSAVVVEHMNYRSPRVGEHIPPRVKPLLASLGLQDDLASGKHARCPGITSVWGSDQPVERHYLFDPHGEGINLSRPEFDLKLAALAEASGATVRTDAAVIGIEGRPGAWNCKVRAGGAVLETSCRVIVDATGRNTSIARRLGATQLVYDELLGMVGSSMAAAPRTHLVLIEALADGWWYSAGLSDASVVATFFSDPATLANSNAARPALWRERLDDAPRTRARIAAPEAVEQIHVRIARTQRLETAAGDGWLAAGDAAMSFDPLSSQGIAKAIEWAPRVAAAAAGLCRDDDTAAREYAAAIERVFSEYLLNRYRYYAAEKRWPASPFWSRRREPPKPISLRCER